MASITTSLSINNAAATAKTFAIATKSPELLLLEERTAGVQSQFITMRFRGQKPAGARKFARAEFKTILPVVRTINGVATVIDYNEGLTAFKLSQDSNATERADVFAYHVNGMSNAGLKVCVTDLDYPY